MGNGKHLLDAYEAHQKQRGLSTDTLRRRRISLTQFARFIEPTTLDNATVEVVEEWLGTFPVATTRRAYRADLSAFYTWAVRRSLCFTNPILATDPIRCPRALPRPIDPMMVPLLVVTAPDTATAHAIALAAYAGLRCAEIANLTRDDLSPNMLPPVLYVRQGKGRKDRVVPMHPRLVELMRNVGAGRVVPFQKQTISRKVGLHLAANGINATLHQLRHTFATEAMRVSRDIMQVQELLGHEEITTTARYARLAPGLTVGTVDAMYL